ncbi:MAG: asparaginase [halophilic archaeon J07HX64]|jgi:asparaginase (EC 3.5.1.1)|nr:MAG: asparaginase [halophilic archaeon J07HX64]
MRVIVHGGAGGTAEEPAVRQHELGAAAAAGTDTQDPVDAAVTAAAELESAPRFNAGVGSAVQSDGRIRTDAGLMVDNGTTGAACSMAGVEHAAEVARVVASETPHVLLAGERATDLAAASGVATDSDLWTDRTRERWADLDAPDGDMRDHLGWVREQFGGADTIGAVATDGETVATVTSTGGRWCALAGRVGDVPQVGAGFYAADGVAASATGAGEAIARFGLARRAVDLVGDLPPQLAADRAMDEFGRATDEQAGLILLDTAGQTGSTYNSEEMLTAVRGDPTG